MSELIDRDELKKHLMDMTRLRTNSEIGEPTCGLTRRTVFHMSEIMKVVIDMPTIERKTGMWSRAQYGYTCNQCGKTHLLRTTYCPSCGAEMDF